MAPDIDNPEYKHDDKLYLFKDLKYVGFELWQVKAGSIFDNIIITDSLKEAEQFAKDTWAAMKDKEKEQFDKIKAVSGALEEGAGGGCWGLGGQQWRECRRWCGTRDCRGGAD